MLVMWVLTENIQWLNTVSEGIIVCLQLESILFSFAD